MNNLSKLFIFLFFVSCNKIETSYEIPYKGDKVVINGFIDNEIGCEVKISKSGAPIWKDTLKDVLTVDSARVQLYENGNLIQELTQNKEKKYVSNGFLPKVGYKYKIKALVKNLPDTESEDIIFDEKPQIDSVTSKIADNVVFNNKGVVFDYTLNFDDSKINYFVVNEFADTLQTGGYFYNLSNLNLSCDVRGFYFDHFFSTKCLKKTSKIRWAVSLNNYSSQEPKIIKYKISKTSKNYYDYKSSHDLNVYTSWDMALLEPNYAVSNIKNGYGIFYFKNSITLTHKL
jgi:Domain of unknown function (DUF4249)